MLRVGIDTGGTFTDLYAVHRGRVLTHKVRSTPRDPARAVLEGLQDLCERTGESAATIEIVYGSTIATNALLERRGGRAALVTTRGFEDVLEIGRQARPSLYDLDVRRPPPLVPRARRHGVAEAVAPDGSIEHALRRTEARVLASKLSRQGIEAVAVCLLFSYANPVHERRLERALRARGLLVSASHRLLPEFREYERSSTTAVNAYLLPVVGPALHAVQRAARVRRFSVLQSNGGRLSIAAAAREPVRLLLSGPAGGALGAWQVARRAGLRRALGLDMGGTSADVSLLDGGPPARLSEAEIASCALRVPMLDIHTVGAGGGSIAWRDAGGALRVGPQSAGSDPGPACLGRGEHATVTDANVVLGRIRAHDYLGGRIALDPRRAERAVAKLAASLGLDVHATALGIVRVVNATMEQALRVVSVERGLDVRDFSLLAFGGAAGLHAADLVRALGLRGALVPAHAAVLSALGLVHADVEKDFGQSVLVPAGDADWRRLFAPLLARARRELRVEGVARPRLERSLDMRYVGQSFELNVPWSAHFERDFHRLHARRYGFAADGEPVEIVAVRVRAVGRVQPPSSVRSSVPRTVRKSETQSLHFEMQGRGRTLPARVVQRAALRPSHRLRGPALVLEPDTTILVPPDFVARVRSHGGLWLEPRARRG